LFGGKRLFQNRDTLFKLSVVGRRFRRQPEIRRDPILGIDDAIAGGLGCVFMEIATMVPLAGLEPARP
jgi:hypothetical protein